MKKYLLILIFLIPLYSCITEDTPVNTGVECGDPLPIFSVKLNNGEEISTSSLFGKTVLIEFFNTSCMDCREGLPAVNILYEEFKDNPDIMIFAISREENAASIENYWNQNAFSIPYSAQNDRDIYNLFASTGIPRTYIADKNGVIRFSFGDSEIPTVARLRDALNSLR